MRPLLHCYIGVMLIKRLPFLALLLFASIIATAQTPTPSIVGTWVLTSADKLLPNGTRVSDYGEHPHGLVIFTRDGYYSVQIYRADRLKFSSGDKPKGTPEEYKDASLSTSVHFGRYTLDPAHATITFHIDRSSFPNQDDTTQVRPYQLKGDQLSWKVPPRPDGSIPITVLHRVTSEEHPPVKGLN
ncbi:MAG: lipocalin-like domain-containing protein [Acidobacteriaceae bacterium]